MKNNFHPQLARSASIALSNWSKDQRNQALLAMANLLNNNPSIDFLLSANQQDLNGNPHLAPGLKQRLILTKEKIHTLVAGIRQIADLPDPLNKMHIHRELADQLHLCKYTVPIGVIAVIFESRPDVMAQIVPLALKTGNAVVLKGGKEASNTNAAFFQLFQSLTFLPQGWCSLLHDREEVDSLLAQTNNVDLVIPRGSRELILHVMTNTKIPVLGHADGVCHIYVGTDIDVTQALNVIEDAKTQYPAACNSVETVLVDASIAKHFLPALIERLKSKQIEMFGCEKVRAIIPDLLPATDWTLEFGGLKLNIKIVENIDESIDHINTYGSHHTDCILSQNKDQIDKFTRFVDSACVFANASTRFADGFRFGLGAEVGISTSKIHARGPVGLEGLISTKFVLQGQNHIVKPFVDGLQEFHFKDL